MMYDPLPPLDSVSCYPPSRTFHHQIDDENPVMLFLRSFFPSFSRVSFLWWCVEMVISLQTSVDQGTILSAKVILPIIMHLRSVRCPLVGYHSPSEDTIYPGRWGGEGRNRRGEEGRGKDKGQE